MKFNSHEPTMKMKTFYNQSPIMGLAALLSATLLAGCLMPDYSKPGTGLPIGWKAPSNFEQALKDNEAVLAAGTVPPDVALYNIGLYSVHSENPTKDYAKALRSFRILILEHPKSALAEQAKVWIQALELHQKSTEEGIKLAEERRALAREHDQLTQERNKLNYATEKSRQLDADIEKRRKATLKR